MRRWHQERHIAEHRQKLAKQYHPLRSNQLGRYRKRHPLDCGHSRCRLCHFDKLMGYRHEQQIRADASFEEQLGEL